MKAIAAALALLIAAPADAHSWYDPYCCNADDCRPIPEDAVEATPGGWIVTLTHDDHPDVPPGETMTRTFRYQDGQPGNELPSSDPSGDPEARQSPDSLHHACVFMGRIRCFYEQMRGF